MLIIRYYCFTTRRIVIFGTSFFVVVIVLLFILLLNFLYIIQQQQQQYNNKQILVVPTIDEFFQQQLSIIIEQDKKKQYYIIDSICSGCRHAIASKNTKNNDDTTAERCGVLIQEQYEKGRKSINNTYYTYIDAANNIANKYIDCRICSTTNNNNKNCNKKYWYYDTVIEPYIIQQQQTYYIKDTWVPYSLPSEHHLSNNALQNVTSYFISNINHTYPYSEYYMEYNPSIVILPEYIQNKFSNNLLSYNNDNKKYYLISIRISNQHYCFHPVDRKRMAGGTTTKKSNQTSKDYLGLSIIESDTFNIVMDTIIDMKQVGFPSAVQDFRLHVLPSSKHEEQEQLYISSYDVIVPIDLFPFNYEQIISDNNGNNIVIVPRVFDLPSDNNLNNRLHFQVVIMKPIACASCEKRKGFCGKNFNYFSIYNNNDNYETFVEIWPSGPRMVRPITLNKPCNRQEKTSIITYTDNDVDYNNIIIQPSFATIEEIDFSTLHIYESILTRGRGSACCIELNIGNNNNNIVLVGIQHSKTPSQRNRILPKNLIDNHYLSSFYAFDINKPYKLIAQSGWFCLGFPSTNNDDNNIPTIVHATSWRILNIGRNYSNCPRIHFVSGMTISATDPTTVLIGYGINDCYTRFISIKLEDIKKLLFGNV